MRIYELDPAAYKRRRDELIGLFSLEPLLTTPVRKLSLGERMRCELAAALLHQPQVLFLDEPMERVCKRVIVINHGQIRRGADGGTSSCSHILHDYCTVMVQ